MDKKTLLILGGYGGVGKPLARLLLQETGANLMLAGRTIKKAKATAAQFNNIFKGSRVTGIYCDASDAESLKRACKRADLIIVASSTARYAERLAKVVLEADIDYLDLQYSTKKIALLKTLVREIEKSGHCFITDGGFHPGLPAALIRYVAQYFDRLEKANVGSVIKYDFGKLSIADSTAYEFIEEINDFEPLIFKEGQWKRNRLLGMTSYTTMDFGPEFGKQYCVPMFLEEMRSIPEIYPFLRETGFFVGGFNWFVDWLILPLALITLKIWPRMALKPMGKLIKWGLKTFSKPPYGTLLKVDAQGQSKNKAKTMEITVYHQDAYMFTAIPVVACLLQYLDGSIRKAGLWTQANIVETNRLMKDMERMGVHIQIHEKTGNDA
jgi:saccharopine dehydrogenase (NAD+, L-lysine-forming)